MWKILSFLISLLPLCAAAQEIEVDLELFLAVDVSRSMSPEDLDIQRRGYAEALTSPEVTNALQSGLNGKIALTYVEWAEDFAQRVIVPWTLVETSEDAAKIAGRITAHFDASLRRTSISGALRYAARDFEDNGFKGFRRVIDISGDGPNNQGSPVEEARDAAIAQGIIINGLPLMTEDAISNIWGIPDLDVYYQRCVIGGPGAFVIPVFGWSQFPDAVRRKLVLEIAGVPAQPRIIKAQSRTLPPYDCMVGEKMWRDRRSFFDIP